MLALDQHPTLEEYDFEWKNGIFDPFLFYLSFFNLKVRNKNPNSGNFGHEKST